MCPSGTKALSSTISMNVRFSMMLLAKIPTLGTLGLHQESSQLAATCRGKTMKILLAALSPIRGTSAFLMSFNRMKSMRER
jgi:hypothetical protein